jgi:hypothetical protein
VDLRQKIEKLQNQYYLKYFAVSAKTNENIPEAIKHLNNMIYKKYAPKKPEEDQVKPNSNIKIKSSVVPEP